MQLKNSTDWSDRFLRRMLTWCCNEIGYKVRDLRGVQFRNRKTKHYSGRAYLNQRRIVVSIAAREFQRLMTCRAHIAGKPIILHNRLEALVKVTTHELAHLCQWRDGRRKLVEHDADWHAGHVLDLFRADHEQLIAAWSATAERPKAPAKSKQQVNADKAEQFLVTWQRKLKLAQTKVKQYRAKVRRYERLGVTAACRAKGE